VKGFKDGQNAKFNRSVIPVTGSEKGFEDGQNTKFSFPCGDCVDFHGNIIVADSIKTECIWLYEDSDFLAK